MPPGRGSIRCSVDRLGQNDAHNVRLVQGSHIVVPKLFDHDRGYIFQNTDGRIIFAIPYEDDFTLIGTTDQDFDGDPDRRADSGEEIAYLCDAASEYFERRVTPRGCGLDLFRRASALRRRRVEGAGGDARLCAEGRRNGPGGAIINIFGGKITTYRRLAESVLEKIEVVLGARGAAWTAGATLPGGDFPVQGFEALVSQLKKEAPDVPEATIRRLARNYGTRARQILGAKGELGRIFDADLGENEVDYLMDQEWARDVEDVLWRRSKLGLRFSPDKTAALTAHMKARLTARDRAGKSTSTSNSGYF